MVVRRTLTVFQLIGAILIFCACQVNDLPQKKIIPPSGERVPAQNGFEAVEIGVHNGTTDPQASVATRKLFNGLRSIQGKHIIFGHQNANLEGVGWKLEGIPDVEQVSGRMPGVVGYDLREVIKYPHVFRTMYYHKVREAHRRGAVITFSWHMENPVTRGPFNDKTPAIHAILPEGELHHYYKQQLDQAAEFFFSLRDDQGVYIPIIFRPFHEHNGHWFWWSHTNRTCQWLCFIDYGHSKAREQADNDFIKLWRFTVDYLRRGRGVHHLLIAYSPDINPERPYFWRWPGNQYVDILGVDKYVADLSEIQVSLDFIVREALKRQKLAAITETGLEGITMPHYWTKGLLRPIKTYGQLAKFSYVMVWRNSADDPKHFYAPFHGHPSVANFLDMTRDNYVLLAGEGLNQFLR